MDSSSAAVSFTLLLLLAAAATVTAAPTALPTTTALPTSLATARGLHSGFYKGKCGLIDVEAVIGRFVMAWFVRDPTITPALLRMQFHDCFVRGCDASILLDGPESEKAAPPNQSVRGYDLIDQIKAALEKLCPGLVSCADIVVAATRDAVVLSGGVRYEVQTGRRDGVVSSKAAVNLPLPSISVSQSIQAFAQKGLNAVDMVLLLGGHTVGIAHCSLFQDRLYDFQNTGKPDPTMNATLAAALRKQCLLGAKTDNVVNLDQGRGSALVVDNSYYGQLLARRGILQIDQALALNKATKATVVRLAAAPDFGAQFGSAMVRLGAVGVLTGNSGQIRKVCRAVNK